MFLHSIHRKPHDLLENTGILQLQYSGREFFFLCILIAIAHGLFFAGYCPWSLIFLRTNGTILNTIMKKCHSNWCSSLDFENAWSFFFRNVWQGSYLVIRARPTSLPLRRWKIGNPLRGFVECGGRFGEKPWVGLEPEWAMVFDDPKIRC